MNAELEDTPTRGLDSRWTHGIDDPTKFREQLMSQTLIWRQLLKILKELFRTANAKEFDLEKPNLHERIIYNEGYKQCLTDIYKLIPTQKETIR